MRIHVRVVVVVKMVLFKCNSYKSLKRRPTSCKGNRKKHKHPLFTCGLSSERMYRRQTGKTSQNKSHLFSLKQCHVEDPSFNWSIKTVILPYFFWEFHPVSPNYRITIGISENYQTSLNIKHQILCIQFVSCWILFHSCGFMNKRKTITRIKNIEKIYSKVIKFIGTGMLLWRRIIILSFA